MRTVEMPGLHKALRVLVVEDEPRMRDLLVESVPEMGFPATAVRSAEEALRTMQKKPHDILILDLQLPLMGGMELLEQIRTRWPDSQVIILTGFGDLVSAQRAIHLDVVEFLTKPCHLRDLELALDRARRRSALASLTATPVAQPEQPESALTLAELERREILAALQRHGGNRTAAAAELGISRRTLHYRLAEYRAGGNPPV